MTLAKRGGGEIKGDQAAMPMCLLAKPHFQFEMQGKKEKWNVN